MASEALASLVCRAAIAFVWLYHGFVPKLLGPHEDEMAMNLALGISPAAATLMSYAAGAGEMALGILVLIFWRQTWPLWLTIALMISLLAYAGWATPWMLVGAFNPVTINIAVAALAVVALMLKREVRY